MTAESSSSCARGREPEFPATARGRSDLGTGLGKGAAIVSHARPAALLSCFALGRLSPWLVQQ